MNRKKDPSQNRRYHATKPNKNHHQQQATYATVVNSDHSEQSTAVPNDNINRLLTMVPYTESTFSRAQIEEINLDVFHNNKSVPTTSGVTTMITESIN